MMLLSLKEGQVEEFPFDFDLSPGFDCQRELYSWESKFAQDLAFAMYHRDLTREDKQHMLLTSLCWAIGDAEKWPVNEAAQRLRVLWSSVSCNACDPSEVFIEPAGYTGSLFPKYLFIGASPGADSTPTYLQDERPNRCWIRGISSELLRKAVYSIGILPESGFTNVTKCAIPNNNKLPRLAVERCAPWLTMEIQLLHPEKVIIMGNEATENFARTIDAAFPHLPWQRVYHPSYYARKGMDWREYGEYLKAKIEE